MPDAASDPLFEAPKPPEKPAEGSVSASVRLEADLVGSVQPSFPALASEDPARRRVILIADDDEDMRLYLRRCLTGPGLPGVEVVEAADGREALERARQGGVDLVVSDLVMPHMDGLSLWRALQADEALRRVPVLLITGEGAPPSLPEGACEVLAKPFNKAALLAGASRLLGSPSKPATS